MKVFLLASLITSPQAIVRRSDVADSEYKVAASDTPYIVTMNPGSSASSRVRRSHRLNATGFNVECAGTMISTKHVITAAHCFEDGASQSGFKVQVNGAKIKVAKVHFNPDCEFNLKKDGPNECDTAIVELNSNADVEPVPVYQWDDETGKHMDIYGWGVSGNAASIKAKDCDDGSEDGNFRHGENTVDRVSSEHGGGIIYYSMSKNGASATLPLEAISASGDSGGPTFIQGPDGRRYIAGTNSGSDDNNGCKYGATDQYCRLSRHFSWIHSIIGGPPSPVPSPTPRPAPVPTPVPTPMPEPMPAPTPVVPQGKCTQRCLDWTINTCPVEKYPTYKKCFKCGDALDMVDIVCPKLKDQEDCCHTLTDGSSDLAVV